MSNNQGAHREIKVPEGQPSGYFVLLRQDDDDGESIDLAKIVAVMLRSWRLLAAAVFGGAVIAAVIVLLMPNVYRAQVLIAPVTPSSGGPASLLRSQFGGLAALAGIDLGSSGGRKEESYATLVSAGFARDFIVAENLMPILFADRWDPKTNGWRTGKRPPSIESGVKKFTMDVRSISEDRKTGMVTVAVEWYSPELAARWANRMVEMVNERLRAEATRNAERSIEYLNKELAKTAVVEVRQAVYELIETQVNNAMLANVQREYAFRVIDPAVPPEMKVSPKRTVMVIAGALIGLFVGLIVIFLRRASVDSRRSS